MKDKINIWAWIKWLWKFSPTIWLIVFTLFTIIFSSLVFGEAGFFISFTSLILMWIIGIFGYVAWIDNGDDIKKYVRRWKKHTRKWLDTKPK